MQAPVCYLPAFFFEQGQIFAPTAASSPAPAIFPFEPNCELSHQFFKYSGGFVKKDPITTNANFAAEAENVAVSFTSAVFTASDGCPTSAGFSARASALFTAIASFNESTIFEISAGFHSKPAQFCRKLRLRRKRWFRKGCKSLQQAPGLPQRSLQTPVWQRALARAPVSQKRRFFFNKRRARRVHRQRSPGTVRAGIFKLRPLVLPRWGTPYSKRGEAYPLNCGIHSVSRKRNTNT
jgi:hypothetical protein